MYLIHPVHGGSARGLLAAACLLAVACNGDSGGPTGPSPGTTSSVSVTYPADHGMVYIGDQVQFQATVSSSGSGTQAATNAVWESDAPAIATVSSSGLVTAVSAGEATISAEVPAGGRGAQSIRVFPEFHGHWEGDLNVTRIAVPRDWRELGEEDCNGLPDFASWIPLAADFTVDVFEGSTADPMTVARQVAKIRERFGLQQVVLVGDRGMLTAARIREDLQGVDGLRWITTLRAPTIRKLVNAGAVTPSFFDERDLAEITSEEFPGERLIVCRNPLLAAERQRKRQERLAATEKDLEPIVAATRRQNRPLCGASTIGLRVGKVINRHKMAKHFVTDITDDTFTFRRNEEKIAAEERLDGIYIVRSNVEPARFDAAQTVRAYKDLSKVERAFRSLKSVDLKVRPLHHRRADRVRAHVLLCMLAYYVEWHMRRALAPLLFDDHDPAAAERRRASVVAPARRSRQGRPQTHRRRPAGAQLPDPAHRPGNARRQHDAGRRRRQHLHPADATDAVAAALQSSYWGSRRTCSHHRHHAEGRNRLNKNDFYAIRPETSV